MEMLRHQPNYHRRMMAKRGVEVRFGVEATAEIIAAEKPDVVVIATGAEPVVPEVKGLAVARAEGFALTIDQVLNRSAPVKPGRSVIIWGAGEGAELAIDLKRGGHEVRLLDNNASYKPANYVGSRVYAIKALLGLSGITVETGLQLDWIEGKCAGFAKADGTQEIIPADTLVICQGRKPLNNLAAQLAGKGFTIHTIGDARAPRSYGNAIHEAAYLVRNI
jgi:pyruvate/2-oxoglutarate dehydrogenase complex dihydrolipoamide dehydrogenase (E3) component